MRKNTSRSAISQGMRGSMQPVVFTCEIRNIRREDLLDTYFQINLVISGSGEDIGTWMNCHYKLAISPRYPLLWLNDVMVGLLVKASTSAISILINRQIINVVAKARYYDRLYCTVDVKYKKHKLLSLFNVREK